MSITEVIKTLNYFSGMPMYKNPFEKGQLIIQFLVNFPARIPPEVIPALENCLPSRPRVSNNICLLYKVTWSRLCNYSTLYYMYVQYMYCGTNYSVIHINVMPIVADLSMTISFKNVVFITI